MRALMLSSVIDVHLERLTWRIEESGVGQDIACFFLLVVRARFDDTLCRADRWADVKTT